MDTETTLRRLASAKPRPGPLVFIVMDGVGIGRGDEGDAVALARTPTLDRLRAGFPHTRLKAHGKAVGMPSDSDMGNSEVGHNALGCGRVFDQGAKLVDRAIETGAIFESPVWQDAVRIARGGGTLHLIGLLSDGNVHSHIDHLFALLRRADNKGVPRARVHVLLDGRDVGETSAFDYVDPLEALLAKISTAPDRDYRIASGGGRMLVTMDRYEADWSIVERGWNAHVHGEGRPFPSARAAIETYRTEEPGTADQFLPAFVVADEGGPVGTIEDGDVVLMTNFRGDRAIEISRAFTRTTFPHFDRGRRPKVLYAGLMEYDGDLHIPDRFLVEPPAIDRTLNEYLCRSGVTQLAAAETQKYGHMTYFWNGNLSGLLDPTTGRYGEVAAEEWKEPSFTATLRRSALETDLEVRSDAVPFEQRPWMKAAELTDAVIAQMRTGHHRFVRVNYANGDMVGHTGHREAAVTAVAVTDMCLARLVREVARQDGLLAVTADHGNADEMYMWDKKAGDFQRDEEGRPKPKTSHTLNPVPLLFFDPRGPGGFRIDPSIAEPGLANMAATLLALLGFQAPEGYHPSLISF